MHEKPVLYLWSGGAEACYGCHTLFFNAHTGAIILSRLDDEGWRHTIGQRRIELPDYTDDVVWSIAPGNELAVKGILRGQNLSEAARIEARIRQMNTAPDGKPIYKLTITVTTDEGKVVLGVLLTADEVLDAQPA